VPRRRRVISVQKWDGATLLRLRRPARQTLRTVAATQSGCPNGMPPRCRESVRLPNNAPPRCSRVVGLPHRYGATLRRLNRAQKWDEATLRRVRPAQEKRLRCFEQFILLTHNELHRLAVKAVCDRPDVPPTCGSRQIPEGRRPRRPEPRSGLPEWSLPFDDEDEEFPALWPPQALGRKYPNVAMLCSPRIRQ
jgi:hypothetical protein